MSRPIYGLTIRALLGQRRTLALVLLSLAPVFMALVFSLAADADADPHNFYSRLVQRLFIPVITALVALIVGVSAIGDEREDGTILYAPDAALWGRLELILIRICATNLSLEKRSPSPLPSPPGEGESFADRVADRNSLDRSTAWETKRKIAPIATELGKVGRVGRRVSLSLGARIGAHCR